MLSPKIIIPLILILLVISVSLLMRKPARFAVYYNNPPIAVMIASSLFAALTYGGGYYVMPTYFPSNMINRRSSLVDKLTLIFIGITFIAFAYYLYKEFSNNEESAPRVSGRSDNIRSSNYGQKYVALTEDVNLTQIPLVKPTTDFHTALINARQQESQALTYFSENFIAELDKYNTTITSIIPAAIRDTLRTSFNIEIPLVCGDIYTCDYSVIITHVDSIISALTTLQENELEEINNLREQLALCTTNNATVLSQIQQLNNSIQQTEAAITALNTLREKIASEIGLVDGKLLKPTKDSLKFLSDIVEPCETGVCL